MEPRIAQDEEAGMLTRIAQAIYEAASPHQLAWDELTAGQRRNYLDAGRAALRSTDRVGCRAALERAAQAIAEHHGYTGLSTCPPRTRRRFRFLAIDAVRAYTKHLTDASRAFDDAVLALQMSELRAGRDRVDADVLRRDRDQRELELIVSAGARVGGEA